MHHRLPCAIDIEASGFGRRSYPIEIGYVREDGQAWCTLIQPADDWTHWDTSAEQLHRIARTTLLLHGRPVCEVAERLNHDLAGRTVYCDAWAHDYSWLARLFDVAERAPRFRLESVHRLVDESRLGRLDALRRDAFHQFGIARHRASSDARALQWAMGQLMDHQADADH